MKKKPNTSLYLILIFIFIKNILFADSPVKIEFNRPLLFKSKTNEDTSKKDRNIQKGIKLYIDEGLSLMRVRYRDVWRKVEWMNSNESCYANYPKVDLNDPSNFPNIRDRSILDFYLFHINLDLNLQLRWFIIKTSFNKLIFNLSNTTISISSKYGGLDVYHFFWWGYSNRYKNKKWYFSILKSWWLMNLITLPTSYNSLYNTISTIDRDVAYIKSYPYDIPVDGLNFYNMGTTVPWEKSFNNLYVDFGIKIKECTYLNIYFLYHGKHTFTGNVGVDPNGGGHAPPDCKWDRVLGTDLQLGIKINYLIQMKKN